MLFRIFFLVFYFSFSLNAFAASVKQPEFTDQFYPANKSHLSSMIDNFLEKGINELYQTYQHNVRQEIAEMETVKKALGQDFPQTDELTLVRENHSAVMRELKRMQDEPGYVSEWRPKTVYSTNVLQNVQHAQRLFKQA